VRCAYNGLVIQNPLTLLFAFAVLVGTGVIVGATAIVVLGGDDLGPANGCRNAATGEVRPVQSDVALSESFQRAWDQIAHQLLAGQAEVTASFSESDVTSRARDYLGEKDVPVSDVIICFHDGTAEARAKVKVPGASDIPLIGGLFDTTARVTGKVDMTTENPRLVITDFDAGDLPGFLEDAARDEVESAVNDHLTEETLQFGYTVTFAEGTATVTGRARPAAP